ncbi:MAG TPA: site-specific integrase [Candidatus Hydrogenedentes bacterium]|nr:site-specific integrase [Candidatus Hydrogenedentota bacterium]
MRAKILKTTVEGVKPGAKDVLVWDTEIKGFGCKVTPAGRRVYVYNYRSPDGRMRRINLGTHGTITADAARELARERGDMVAKGIDPLETKAAARVAPTVSALCDEYLERHARLHKKARSVADDEGYIERYIKPRLGTLKVAAVGRSHISKLHHDMSATPTTANRVLACLSKMFNLAEVWGHRPDGSNPCRHVKRYRENKRQRYLTAAEITRLGAVLAKEDKEALRGSTRSCVAAVRLLLLTGMRMGEVLGLRWSDVDLDRQRIELTDSKVGGRTVWLNAPAVAVIEGLKADREEREKADKPVSEWLLPGNREGDPLRWLETFWARVRKDAEIPNIRLHDLRHTVGSIAASEGIGLPIVGAVLGHTQPATTQRYAHVQESPALAAVELVGQRIGAALSGGVAEVVDVTKKAERAASQPKAARGGGG